jgi:threonylcarbamoyladenosine tRNA methylthiotransferase MtaB
MFKNKTVAFYTLGCKLNFAETSTIGRQLYELGFSKTDFSNNADLYVINTCSVTENANKECRRIIRNAKKNSPDSFIVVTGCYAQLKPTEIIDIQGVDIVLGANEKFNLPKIISTLKQKNKNKKIHGCEIENLNFFSSFSLLDRTRSFLKIQDGCDYPCSYCTIPLARGKSRSDNIKNILKNATEIVNKGNKEIVITGVNIGDFKDKNTNENFSDLIKELDKINGVERYRISSIEPNLITNDIINTVKKSNKFMPHFHIPLQSGSDLILGKMKRRYQTKLYSNLIKYISKEIKNVCIGADVIVGFPGESEKEFNETVEFIKNLPISYLHVFSYSERENTTAIELKNKVSTAIKKERSKKLRILSKKLERKFYQNHLQQSRYALFEQENKNGMIYGFTDNYIKVKMKFNNTICKTTQKVLLNQIDNDGIMNVKII